MLHEKENKIPTADYKCESESTRTNKRKLERFESPRVFDALQEECYRVGEIVREAGAGVAAGWRGAGWLAGWLAGGRVTSRVTCPRAPHTSSFCAWRSSSTWNSRIACMKIYRVCHGTRSFLRALNYVQIENSNIELKHITLENKNNKENIFFLIRLYADDVLFVRWAYIIVNTSHLTRIQSLLQKLVTFFSQYVSSRCFHKALARGIATKYSYKRIESHIIITSRIKRASDVSFKAQTCKTNTMIQLWAICISPCT